MLSVTSDFGTICGLCGHTIRTTDIKATRQVISEIIKEVIIRFFFANCHSTSDVSTIKIIIMLSQLFSRQTCIIIGGSAVQFIGENRVLKLSVVTNNCTSVISTIW